MRISMLDDNCRQRTCCYADASLFAQRVKAGDTKKGRMI
jgi:hypothetical protein